MSDQIKHECGIALVRLLKPLEYYLKKYGTFLYGLNKLHLLMQKQHNRGQDGAGIANIKFDLEPGYKYINCLRSGTSTAIQDIFNIVYKKIEAIGNENTTILSDIDWLKRNVDFIGELYMGHLRYATFGMNTLSELHPFVRKNNWKTRNLAVIGNFNLTNMNELFSELVSYGQFPVETSDAVTIMEKIGHYLDEANNRLYKKNKEKGISKKKISDLIEEQLDVQDILKKASVNWDGGYVIAGMIGHGDAFVLRDPSGIRPVYYYKDEEVVAVTSERPVIQTAFNVTIDKIYEIKAGHALVIKRNGHIGEFEVNKPQKRKSCSFERIYFSRGTDMEIYRERKKLGAFLAPNILKAIDYDFENTVFSYIPNTASVAFLGLIEELDNFCYAVKKDKIIQLGNKIDSDQLEKILYLKPRIEEVAVKDIKLRTFITQDTKRDDLAAHVYDITYGTIRPGIDNLVVLDDSIVRGTTLKQSIIRILDRLNPKKIVVASSAPQIRYPDCYGIDMSKLNDFIAFRAAIELLNNTNQKHIISEIYKKCKAQEKFAKENVINYVKEIYKPFSINQISEKISNLLTHKEVKAKVEIIYQTIDDLHLACPNHLGDWYFTGDYPSPGGNSVVNRSFINYIENKNERAY